MGSNRLLTVFTSTPRTTTANSEDFSNSCGAGVYLVLDITAASGVLPTLDVKFQRKDHLSGKYVDLPDGAFAQKSATGTDDLVVYPGVAQTMGRSVSDHMGYVWRAVATIGGTTPSFTFSLAGARLG